MLRRNRVAVSGFGILAANGIGPEAFWKSLVEGESGIGQISLFDASEHPIQIAGEVKNFVLADYCETPVKEKRLSRQAQFALAAVHMALRDAGLSKADLQRGSPLPIVVGVSSSAFEIIEHAKEQLDERGPQRVSSHVVGSSQPHGVASVLSTVLGVPTQVLTISSACQAGLDAVAQGAEIIRSGKADIVIAGGTDAPISPLAVASFGTSGLVPQWKGDPRKASRPFDRNRCGGLLAEGSCFVILENFDHACARGRPPQLTLEGTAVSTDPINGEPGTGFALSMKMALANTSALPRQIGYVCANAPSDITLDRVETVAIKEVLGDHAFSIPVSSIKGVIGNPLSAAGPLQLAACALAFRHNLVPPTANYEHRDPQCDLDYVMKRARVAKVDMALINVHGMGGSNRSLVVERVI